MAHGGKRPSAGRKKGSTTKRHRPTKARAAAEGITPAEVMQKAMEVHFKAKRYDEAARIAKDLAPYVHPRLASVQHGGTVGVLLEVVEEIVGAPPGAGGEHGHG